MAEGVSGRGHKPPQGEPVLDRAFRILASFGPADRSLSLTSLSARAGLPTTSALRIARKLVELGALDRDEDGRYAAALPYLEDLHHATGQHVLLAVREGREAVLVERLSARGARRVLYRIGGRMPMHSTSVGLVLLAHAPVAVQDEILAGDLTGQPDGDLRVQLAAIRRDGMAAVSRTSPEAVTSVAAPVLRNRQAVAALSVVGQTDQLRPTALAPAVVAVARAVSRAVSQLQP